MALSREELEFRKGSLGASDLPMIVEPDHQWGDGAKLYWQKQGKIPIEESDAEHLLLGNLFEPLLLNYVEAVRGPVTERGRRFEYTYSGAPLHATVDGLLLRPDGIWVVEAKAAIRHCAEFGEAGTDEIPARVAIQCYQQQALVEDEYMRSLENGENGWRVRGSLIPVARSSGGGIEIVIFELPADPELQRKLLDAGASWWLRHMAAGVPPEATERARDVLAKVERLPHSVADVPSAVLETIESLRQQEKELTKQRRALEAVAMAAGTFDDGVGCEILQGDGCDHEIRLRPVTRRTLGKTDAHSEDKCEHCGAGYKASTSVSFRKAKRVEYPPMVMRLDRRNLGAPEQ